MNFLLHRRITICMLFIALTMLGYVSYKQLPVELLPNAELPTLFVQVSSQQDMDPSYVESEIIIPLEGAISSIGGVNKIESNVDSRQSSIQVDFKNTVSWLLPSPKALRCSCRRWISASWRTTSWFCRYAVREVSTG